MGVVTSYLLGIIIFITLLSLGVKSLALSALTSGVVVLLLTRLIAAWRDTGQTGQQAHLQRSRELIQAYAVQEQMTEWQAALRIINSPEYQAELARLDKELLDEVIEEAMNDPIHIDLLRQSHRNT